MTNLSKQQTFSPEHYQLLISELGGSLNMEALKALYLGSNSEAIGVDLRLLIEDIYQPHIIESWQPKPEAEPEADVRATTQVQEDTREKILAAFSSPPKRLAPTDICQRTGLDFLTVAGTDQRGKSLLDKMVDDGQLVRDTSSGFHLYELPR